MAEAQISIQDLSFEKILASAITIPGVKVDRREFLATTFAKLNVPLEEVLSAGPVNAGCSQELLKQLSQKLILAETSKSSAASFLAGLPGGFAMAVSIPADVLQFFGMTLRLAQELTYLYGGEDMWSDGQVDDDAIRNELIIYCGAMFGVSGAAAGVRLLTAQIAKTTLKKLPQKALTKTIWYPIVKQVCKAIGVKVTKNSVAKGVSKAIPVVGGVISGGLNFASMLPMGNRLAATLDKASFDYTEAEVILDYNEVSSLPVDESDSSSSDESNETKSSDILKSISDGVTNVGAGISDGLSSIGAGISNLFKQKPKQEQPTVPAQSGSESDDPFETLAKLAKLKDAGIISEEEFSEKKRDILSRL